MRYKREPYYERRNIKEGYKIVSVIDDVRQSFITVIGKVIYKKDKKTYRRINSGGLAVFRSKQRAIEFSDNTKGGACEIWKVEYKQSKYPLFHESDTIVKIKKGIPLGTDFADWVILKKKILSRERLPPYGMRWVIKSENN